jgi:polyisoprenoid-binding protein YceI
MALREGVYQLGPEPGRLLIKTGRTGLGARAGHDLVIEATDWNGRVIVIPSDPAQSSVSVEVDVASLEVQEGTGGVKPLTDSDRAEIKRNIREKILHTTQHPTIAFRSASVGGTQEALTVYGTVGDDGWLRANATVLQSHWGIKPYSAFFGALKLADDVAIEVDAQLTPTDQASSNT